MILRFAIRPSLWHCDDRGADLAHLGLWTTARCDRPSRTERLSMAESLPRHSGLFKPELFLNQGVGEGQRWHWRWQHCILHPKGNSSMVRTQWDPANESERGNLQLSTGRTWGHSVNAYVTVCVSRSDCVFMTVPACVSVHSRDFASMSIYSTRESVSVCERDTRHH